MVGMSQKSATRMRKTRITPPPRRSRAGEALYVRRPGRSEGRTARRRCRRALPSAPDGSARRRWRSSACSLRNRRMLKIMTGSTSSSRRTPIALPRPWLLPPPKDDQVQLQREHVGLGLGRARAR